MVTREIPVDTLERAIEIGYRLEETRGEGDVRINLTKQSSIIILNDEYILFYLTTTFSHMTPLNEKIRPEFFLIFLFLSNICFFIFFIGKFIV